MSEKTAVSALHEYCAKNGMLNPTYEYIQESEGFACEITMLGGAVQTAQGVGRSKRDAKHNACTELLKNLRLGDADIGNVAFQDAMPATDVIIMLRDFCVKHNHPLPNIEIIQQGGTPDAPEFIAVCTLASITRYGSSAKKKDARQKAALEMYKVIRENSNVLNTEVATLDDQLVEIEAQRYKKFKSYRELTDSKTTEMPGVCLSQRHHYFSKFYDPLKMQALNILRSDTYETAEDKCLQALEALLIKPKISKILMETTMEECVAIDFGCEYDVLHVGPPHMVFPRVVNYLVTMLT